MPDFTSRSTKAEYLDQPTVNKKELFLNLAELDRINQLLGGHTATVKGVERLLEDRSKVYHLVDFACGGGDTLRHLALWSKKSGYRLKLYGFDILPEAIEFAKSNSKGYDISYKVADFNNYRPSHQVDIACNALVCHHFYDHTLDSFLLKMKELAEVGIVINDLHRHPLAYHSIQVLTRFFSKSLYVKHDAPLSVLKGFSKSEWQQTLDRLGFEQYHLEWVWAFRHLIYWRKP